MKIYGNFNEAIKDCITRLITLGFHMHPKSWQSTDVSKIKAAEMRELLFLGFQVSMPKTMDLERYRDEIRPNLPWADKHFELERVSGNPINPGETWKEWPWGHSASQFREGSKGQFDHSYAERYWPKYAGYSRDGQLSDYHTNLFAERHGVRNRVGDLNDVVDRLHKDPTTRQAILSVWHPEDQFDYGQRVPCSLTYQFLYRNGVLHTIYNIRSCDAYRHFRDDIYLTCRLALWILWELRKRDDFWCNVSPGFFIMNIGSFHCFINDLEILKDEVRK